MVGKSAPKTSVIVTLQGCDDITEIPLEVGRNELRLLRKLEADSKNLSENQCMPILIVRER